MLIEERVKKEIVDGMCSYLDPEDGYTVMLDLSKEIERGIELGLTEEQVLAFIQGYSVAYDNHTGLGPL